MRWRAPRRRPSASRSVGKSWSESRKKRARSGFWASRSKMAHARLTSPRLEAELYALTHRGTAGDAAFYVRTCSDADRVLELGSGYGRLIAKLARPGRLVTGLEVDAALLSLARRELRL